MALSGSYDYTESVTAANIIALALRRIGVVDPGETIDSTEEANALVTLNLILKEWSAMGADVWVRKALYTFLTKAENSGISYTTDESASYFVTSSSYTTLSADAASGASTVSITTSSFVSDTDLLFIELDSGEIEAHVANGNQSGSTVTLTSTLGGVASSGNAFYVASASNRWQERIIEVISANRVSPLSSGVGLNVNAGRAVPLEEIGLEEYSRLSQRAQSGVPIVYHHSRRPTTSQITIWPTGKDSEVHLLYLNTITVIQDLDSTSDNFFIPSEGHNALAWQLAAEMAPEYGVSEREYNKLWSIAKAKLTDFFDSQVEDASVKFEIELMR